MLFLLHVCLLLRHACFTVASLCVTFPFADPSLFLHYSFTFLHFPFTFPPLSLYVSFTFASLLRNCSFDFPSLLLHSSFTFPPPSLRTNDIRRFVGLEGAQNKQHSQIRCFGTWIMDLDRGSLDHGSWPLFWEFIVRTFGCESANAYSLALRDTQMMR